MLRLPFLDRAFRRRAPTPALVRTAPRSLPTRAAARDTWTTLQVKARLLARLGAGALSINVDTTEGIAALHGRLTSRAAHDTAVAAARSVEGVRGVDDFFVVDDDLEHGDPTEDDDTRLRRRIASKLDGDPRLAGVSVGVVDVEDGVVTLGGQLSWYEDALVAQQDAYTFTGVRAVHAQFTYDGPDGRPREHVALFDEVPGATSVAPQESRDGWLAAGVKNALRADDRLDDGTRVDVHRGVVTLFGTVPDRTARVVARTLAARVSGVHGLYDDLTVMTQHDSA